MNLLRIEGGWFSMVKNISNQNFLDLLADGAPFDQLPVQTCLSHHYPTLYEHDYDAL